MLIAHNKLPQTRRDQGHDPYLYQEQLVEIISAVAYRIAPLPVHDMTSAVSNFF